MKDIEVTRRKQGKKGWKTMKEETKSVRKPEAIYLSDRQHSISVK